jgi:hypothetical protein
MMGRYEDLIIKLTGGASSVRTATCRHVSMSLKLEV